MIFLPLKASQLKGQRGKNQEGANESCLPPKSEIGNPLIQVTKQGAIRYRNCGKLLSRKVGAPFVHVQSSAM